jgi:hypothetical protein
VLLRLRVDCRLTAQRREMLTRVMISMKRQKAKKTPKIIFAVCCCYATVVAVKRIVSINPIMAPEMKCWMR